MPGSSARANDATSTRPRMAASTPEESVPRRASVPSGSAPSAPRSFARGTSARVGERDERRGHRKKVALRLEADDDFVELHRAEHAIEVARGEDADAVIRAETQPHRVHAAREIALDRLGRDVHARVVVLLTHAPAGLRMTERGRAANEGGRAGKSGRGLRQAIFERVERRKRDSGLELGDEDVEGLPLQILLQQLSPGFERRRRKFLGDVERAIGHGNSSGGRVGARAPRDSPNVGAPQRARVRFRV